MNNTYGGYDMTNAVGSYLLAQPYLRFVLLYPLPI